MAEIKCPNCGTIISLEQSDLDSVVLQVRDEQFQKELAERASYIEADKQREIELVQAQAATALKEQAGAKDARIADALAWGFGLSEKAPEEFAPVK